MRYVLTHSKYRGLGIGAVGRNEIYDQGMGDVLFERQMRQMVYIDMKAWLTQKCSADHRIRSFEVVEIEVSCRFCTLLSTLYLTS